MKESWSIVTRIKEYIGSQGFDEKLGTEFLELLKTNKFSEAADKLVKNNVIQDVEIENKLLKHIKSYDYAC